MLAEAIGAGIAISLVLASCSADPSQPAAKDWPLIGRDILGQRYSPLEQINKDNVDKLGLAFEFTDFVVRGRTHRGVEATPLMIGGMLYFSGPWGVAYAVNARTGKHLWTYDPEADGQSGQHSCCDVVNRGVAVDGKRLFTASSDGHLAAVDIKTGKELWNVDTIVDRRWNYSSTGAPYIAGKYVVIGNSGADMGARGYASAYDMATGKLAWRFWVVPGDPRAGPDETPDVTAARRTWPIDTRWELGLGGNPWDGLAYDPETNTTFIGTGNGGPHPAWLRSASGTVTDQLYLSSIVALDADTGRLKWHYQTTPGDSWDYAATSPFVMADLEIDGKPRKVIMQAPKNGFFYVLDRRTGELLRAAPYTPVNWASSIDRRTGRPVLTKQADFRDGPSVIWPSMAGGHSWIPMSYSPKTKLVYLPTYDAAASYVSYDKGEFLPGNADHGTHNAFPPFEDSRLGTQFKQGPSTRFEGRLKAWDPAKGEARWTSEPLPFINGGTLVVGDLVFQGAADGYLRAYDAASGQVLAKLFVGTAMMAAPISYELDGTQYIAILAGFGGPQGGFFAPDNVASSHENYERLIVLKIGGAKLAPPPNRVAAEQQPTPRAIPAEASTIARGQRLFERQCNRCHVMGGAVGIYPDLWNMAPETIDAFEGIVGEGALSYAGMGNFSKSLNRPDIDAIKAFIVNDMIVKRREGPNAGAQFREATH
ncbi:quinohemoprotein alcohol dehydrogenase [Sphingobium sp. SYK-6]|nr:quinohemoprotein alcohol dehydrogenase [Sphingobium sp. SYK-6]